MVDRLISWVALRLTHATKDSGLKSSIFDFEINAFSLLSRMQYKRIYSAIHNFGASFVSPMNYVDGDHVVDDLREIHSKGHDITLNWLTGEFTPQTQETSRIRKSITSRKERLREHLKSENVDLQKLRELRFCWPSPGRKFMIALDDRGKEYKIYVQESK